MLILKRIANILMDDPTKTLRKVNEHNDMFCKKMAGFSHIKCLNTRRLRAKSLCLFFLCVTGVLFISYLCTVSSGYFPATKKCALPAGETLQPGDHVDNSLNLWSRSDVQTCTSWRAPIMWNEMFEIEIYDKYYKEKGTSVALTVFAVGRYLEIYLVDFLTSAEKYFMVALPVDYFVFTDVPHNVPSIPLAPGRTLQVIKVKKHSRWQDISMMRMETIREAIDNHISKRNQFVFCMDVDQVFVGPFGAEALGDSVALLHAYYYKSPVSEFTYDRNPKSEAYMDDGDYYYHAAVFGGTWQSVRNITRSCLQGIKQDKINGVEALWHDESHLNKYFWLYKPSKVLSPEYCWATEIGFTPEIQVHRLVWAEKHYKALRDDK